MEVFIVYNQLVHTLSRVILATGINISILRQGSHDNKASGGRMNLSSYLRDFSIIHAAKLTQENTFSPKPYVALLFNLP